jgi:hypothetical protein
MLAVTFAMMLGAGTPDPAPGLRYWGKADSGAGRGRIQHRGRFLEVRAGDRIPGWGTVRAVNERDLVVRRMLTEAEKQARAAQGLLETDVLDMRIPLARGNVAAATVPGPER